METYSPNFASKLTKFLLSISTLKRMIQFFLLSTLLILPQKTISSEAVEKGKKLFTVVIDAGHGGKDTGALGTFSQEKDIVLKLAIRLGELISGGLPHINVVYTRKTDVFIPLDQRSKIANENKADLFVSLHANSSRNVKAHGTETYVMGLHKTQDNLEVAQKENAVIALEQDYSERYEGYDPKSSESYIIFSLMQNAHLEQSLKIANLIQKEFTDKVKRYERGVKQAGFLVLWNTSMPSVLVEIGFISNREDETFMNSDKGSEEFAQAMYRAIKEYFDELGKKINMLSETKYSANDSSTNIVPALPKKGVVFSVQLTASKAAPDLSKKEFEELQHVFYIWLDGFNKYYHGIFNTYSEAKTAIEKCKKIFPGAFITAFEGEKPIPVDVAIRKKQSKN